MCAFPLNELRISSPLQAAIIALVLGFQFRGMPETASASVWPFVLFGYGVLATVLPWTLGHFQEDEFGFVPSLLLGVVFALPLWLAAGWLEATPYHPISLGCRALAALWVIHVLVSISASVRKKLSNKSKVPL